MKLGQDGEMVGREVGHVCVLSGEVGLGLYFLVPLVLNLL